MSGDMFRKRPAMYAMGSYRKFKVTVDEVCLADVAKALNKDPHEIGTYNFGVEFQKQRFKCFKEGEWFEGDSWKPEGVLGEEDAWFWVWGDLTLSPEARSLGVLEPAPPAPPITSEEEAEPGEGEDSEGEEGSGQTGAKVKPEPPTQPDEDQKAKFHNESVGEGNAEVSAGDCVSSLAVQKGLYWKSVWDHPANDTLKLKRKHPNILLPGDKVFLSEVARKETSGVSEKVHRYQRVGVPAMLRLRFTLFGRPRKKVRYRLEVDGKRVDKGELDEDGALACAIPPDAKEARVFLGTGSDCFNFKLGHLPPVTEVSGLQARLRNLNYYTGPINGTVLPNGEPDLATAEAWELFRQNNCPAVDRDAAIAMLVKAHGA